MEEKKRRRVGLDMSALLIRGWIGREKARERSRRVGLDEKKRHQFEIVGVPLFGSSVGMVLAV